LFDLAVYISAQGGTALADDSGRAARTQVPQGWR
jgi:hypothetical protein